MNAKPVQFTVVIGLRAETNPFGQSPSLEKRAIRALLLLLYRKDKSWYRAGLGDAYVLTYVRTYVRVRFVLFTNSIFFSFL